MDFKLNNKYQVLTPAGYKPFEGISRQVKKTIEFFLDNGKSVEVSTSHPFIICGKIYNSNTLKIGDDLETKYGFNKIIDIKRHEEKFVYDLINVLDVNQYYGNDVLHHNCFLGSSYTLINGQIIEKFKELFKSPNFKKDYKIKLHPNYDNTEINMYSPPQQHRAYIVGADPSEGGDGDFHAFVVLDITNAYQIEVVASYIGCNVPPATFAYMLTKVATLYNYAYVAMERNGVSFAVLDHLDRTYQYEYIISEGSSDRRTPGIFSNGNLKPDACIFCKGILEDSWRQILIWDGRIIDEMERFEKISRPGQTPAYRASSGNDDFMMALIWAMYVLKPELVDSYYDVKKFAVDKLGIECPMFINGYNESDPNKIQQQINELDSSFKEHGNKYEQKLNQLNQLEQQVTDQQEHLMKNFIQQQNDNNNSNGRANIHNQFIKKESGEYYDDLPNNEDDEFSFSGFVS